MVPLGAHTARSPNWIARALARRVQWAVREELELDDPALQGLAAEPVVDQKAASVSEGRHGSVSGQLLLGTCGFPFQLVSLSTCPTLLIHVGPQSLSSSVWAPCPYALLWISRRITALILHGRTGIWIPDEGDVSSRPFSRLVLVEGHAGVGDNKLKQRAWSIEL
jgi:hypothetical protein